MVSPQRRLKVWKVVDLTYFCGFFKSDPCELLEGPQVKQVIVFCFVICYFPCGSRRESLPCQLNIASVCVLYNASWKAEAVSFLQDYEEQIYFRRICLNENIFIIASYSSLPSVFVACCVPTCKTLKLANVVCAFKLKRCFHRSNAPIPESSVHGTVKFNFPI